jgi:hypothetical protein
MSRGLGKTQQQIMELLTSLQGDPLTSKVITAWLSKENDRAVDDRQVRRALYSLEDRGMVELRIQPNPFGRPAICVFLSGAMAAWDARFGPVAAEGARPVRPPKPPPRTLAGECARLAQAAVNYADTEPGSAEMMEAFAALCAVAMDFKPPLRQLTGPDV